MRKFVLLGVAAALFAGPLALGLGPATAAGFTVTIKDFKFDPAELTVAPGDTVTFDNQDLAPHTATADDGSFDTGRLDSGQSATVTIEAAGTHAYICALHPSMQGTVTAE